ncbi:MAG: adenosylcobalamin-dependent ribonucleoside-diphosphate reductase [Steroidobacteraceae bacterium]|jgi:ribonucleoside-diphosphate reductase alpha chain|nr:adenosylcobalamin-dependent ribonucleoside-diphosphate reductase [Steroidobacteraceae bacterium]
MADPALDPLAEHVWRSRYRYADGGEEAENGPADTLARVAGAVAAVERDPAAWASRFRSLMAGFRFLPGGRILANAGTQRTSTLLNCFVMGPIEDSLAGIFEALKEAALTLQQGGGVGYDFSTLRPRGVAARSSGAVAAGPVAWMRLWDEACATVTAGQPRGGAMMATLRVDHPDVLEFAAAKRAGGALERFNLSVAVTDAFLSAVDAGASWPLSFPPPQPHARERVPAMRRELAARALWQAIGEEAAATAEPGVLFLDTLERENNLRWCERLAATNPCGEAPLPPYGACDLGSLNLPAFILDPFGPRSRLDGEALAEAARDAVRLLDDVLDIARYPLTRQREAATSTRRIGLGLTGLGDALAMLGLRYDSAEGRDWAASTMERIKLAAYAASVDLAMEKGPFPAWEREPYLESAFIRRLPPEQRDRLARHGIRNSHLLAIAPAGSISLLAGNVSPGLEPIPARVQRRRLEAPSGDEVDFETEDRAWAMFRRLHQAGASDVFIEAREVAVADQLAMQACLQPHVDGAISKTVALPEAATGQDAAATFREAHRLGLKGCTVYRPGTVRGEAITAAGCARCVPD